MPTDSDGPPEIRWHRERLVLDAAGMSFIVGSRTVKAPGDLASHFHWDGDLFHDGQIIDTVTP